MDAPLIKIDEMCFTRNKIDILHDINLVVDSGDFISIIGPNGGGKTTLLKLILGLLKPSRGTIKVNGYNPGKQLSSVGYVPQYINNNLSFPATAADVVMMGIDRPARRFGLSNKKEERAAAQDVLEKLGVTRLADRKIASLSGGERQRILIARALVSKPQLLVLDEPTASIDTKGQTEFYELLQALNEELTIIMVSHDLMVISSYVKSIICLNRRMHYHRNLKTSGEVLEAFYSCSVEETCPLQLVADKKITQIRQVVDNARSAGV